MTDTAKRISDRGVAEFLDLAKSAHVYFDLINGRLTMRAVNPLWDQWRPFRHLLDEIGAPRIEEYLRAQKRLEDMASAGQGASRSISEAA